MVFIRYFSLFVFLFSFTGTLQTAIGSPAGDCQNRKAVYQFYKYDPVAESLEEIDGPVVWLEAHELVIVNSYLQCNVTYIPGVYQFNTTPYPSSVGDKPTSATGGFGLYSKVIYLDHTGLYEFAWHDKTSPFTSLLVIKEAEPIVPEIVAQRDGIQENIIMSAGEVVEVNEDEQIELDVNLKVEGSDTVQLITAILNENGSWTYTPFEELPLGYNMAFADSLATPHIGTASQSGKYEFTLAGKRVAEVTLLFGHSLGIIEANGPKLTIYPNPCTNQLFFDVQGSHDARGSISIFDQLGRQVFQEQNVSFSQQLPIDLGNLPAGFYFLRVELGETTVTEKIVKR